MYDELMKKLDYQFRHVELLTTALSHRSYGKDNYERLEFLGDSVLNFIVATELFKYFPEAKEGQLSRIRSNLVNEEMLASLARDLNLAEYILLGLGEKKSGGENRPSILSDSVEAIIGAIFLDSNFEICYAKVIGWYGDRIQKLSLQDVHKDPKSLLQELLQSQQLSLPEYRLVSIMGEDHAQYFVIECVVDFLNYPVVGKGTSRRRAEQEAAAHVLEELDCVKK